MTKPHTCGNSVRAASEIGCAAIFGINDTASREVRAIRNGDAVGATTVGSVCAIFERDRLRRCLVYLRFGCFGSGFLLATLSQHMSLNEITRKSV